MGELSLCQLVMSAICANAGSNRPRNSTEGINLVQGIQALLTNLICPWIELWMSINLILRSLLFSFKGRDWEEENIIFSLRIGPIQWLRVTEEQDDGFCNSRLFFIRFLRQIIFLFFWSFFRCLDRVLCFNSVFTSYSKTLTKSIWTPFPCQRPLRDWTRWYSRRYLDLHNSRSILKSML